MSNLKNIKLSKGMSFNLEKDDDVLHHLRVRLIWNDSKYKNSQFDADLTIAMLEDRNNLNSKDNAGRIIYGEEESNLVFYRSDNRYFVDKTPRVKTTYEESQMITNRDRPINICSAHDEIIHTGDNRDGSGDGEEAEIFLDKMQPDVSEIVIVGTIHKGRQRNQNWGALDAKLILENCDTGEQIAELNMGEKLSEYTAVHFASIYRDENDKWKFECIESGNNSGLEYFIEHWI